MSKITEILNIDAKLQQLSEDTSFTPDQKRIIARELGSSLPPAKTCSGCVETRRIVMERIHQFTEKQTQTDASAGTAQTTDEGTGRGPQKGAAKGRTGKTKGAKQGKVQTSPQGE
jgi:hypothetical protein